MVYLIRKVTVLYISDNCTLGQNSGGEAGVGVCLRRHKRTAQPHLARANPSSHQTLYVLGSLKWELFIPKRMLKGQSNKFIVLESSVLLTHYLKEATLNPFRNKLPPSRIHTPSMYSFHFLSLLLQCSEKTWVMTGVLAL